jgi:hypothetical protein
VANWPDFRPTDLIGSLVRAGVDFVVIGGVAVVIQASPRFTRDLDITYATDATNLERLGALLVSLDARLRDVEDEVPFTPDAATLRRVEMLTLSTRDGDLDLLAHPPGAPGYRALRRHADIVELEGASVRIASLEDLIEMKRAAGRPQDEIDIASLEVARTRIRGTRRKPDAH